MFNLSFSLFVFGDLQLPTLSIGYFYLVFKQMPPNPNNSLWRFPDHKKWVVEVKVNSQSKKNLIKDIKEVLRSCGMVQRFRQ